MKRGWTKEQEEFLRKSHKILFSSEIGEKIGKKKGAVKLRMRKLGLKRGSVLRGGHGKQWKGENGSYSAKHMWLRNNFGPANKCENPNCKNINAKRFEWANISGNYKRKRDDYIQLCCSCHAIRDSKFFCKKGHPLWGDNIYQYGIGRRQCKTCNKLRQQTPQSKEWQKNYQSTEEYRKKAREAAREHYLKPEVKERKREYLKNWRRRRKLFV